MSRIHLRHPLRPYLSVAVAIVGAGLVVVAPIAPRHLHAPAVRLTSGDTADFALGNGTALIMGGSSIAIPGQRYVDAFDALYLQPRGFTGTPQALFTPEGAYPLTGVKSLPIDTSQAQGQQILDATIQSQIASGHVDATNPVVVVGYSQSATIASLTMSQLASQDVPSDDVHFVLVGDPNNPDGGAYVRFDGLAASPPSLASMGFTLGGGPTPDDLYPTDIYTIEYDVAGDAPRYPIDFLSVLNADAGFIEHTLYPALTPEQIASVVLLPTTGDTLTNYYIVPAETLPLLFPVQFIPFIGQPLYDLLEPDTRILVNLGYGNIENGWDPGPANVVAPYELFPTDLNWGDVVTALGNGLQQGITDAVEQLQNPDNYNPSAILDNPLLSQLVTVLHTLGFTDATDISQLLNLPSLLELGRNSISSSIGFPMSNVSLFSSSPTEIINALTATFSADYATLLPLADTINSMLTSVPAYDLSVFVHQLEAGNLLAAITDPLIATEVLTVSTVPTLVGTLVSEAASGTMINLADLLGLGGDPTP